MGNMSDLTASNESSSTAVIQTLKWIRKQGFKPVPLRARSKAALDQKYVEAAYAPPADDLWQSKNLGVGVVTGPKHSGPVDVDVDCDEALFFAERFLPPTPAVFGRASKKRSHYLYRVEVPELAKRAFNDPLATPATGGATIIEARADGGHQTVFPGSVHEGTGELIEWADVAFPEVSRVDAPRLDFLVKKVAIAVLIVRHLWAEGQRNEIVKHLSGMFYYLDWDLEETKSLIQAVMDYTDDVDRTRLRTVESSFKKGDAGGKVTGSNTLRTFLGDSRVVDRILDWAGSQSAALLQDYNERFAIVMLEGKFRIAETTPLHRGEPPVLYSKDDFLNYMATDTMDVEDKPVPKARIWMASPRRRSYRSMDFIPGVEDTSPILNLWTGWAMEPSEDGSCQAWLDMVYYTLCGGDETMFNWVIHWFANIVREPLIKPMTALALIGRQGVGKSLSMQYFGKILGAGYITVTNEKHLYGQFNRHLSTTLLLHSEEALYGGDKKHRGIIKSLITDEYRIFEQKGVDAKQVRNYLRLVLTSNEIWAAPAEVNDRRFTIIDMEARKPDDKMLRGVLEEINSGGPARLFHHLLNMEYNPLIPRRNIKNAALISLKAINFEPAVGWWHDVLRSGVILPDYLRWAQTPLDREWPTELGSGALYAALVVKLKERGVRYIPDQSSFAITLNKMLGMTLTRMQRYYHNPALENAPREAKLLPNKQYTITNLPSLKECRIAFDDYVGQKQEWPSEDEGREPGIVRY